MWVWRESSYSFPVILIQFLFATACIWALKTLQKSWPFWSSFLNSLLNSASVSNISEVVAKRWFVATSPAVTALPTTKWVRIKLQNVDDNSIVASVEASTSTRNSVHHAYSTLSYYYLEFHAAYIYIYIFFFLLLLSSIR